MVVIGQVGCIRAKWLYSGKMVIFSQKWLSSFKTCCIWANWLYSGNVLVFGHGGCFWAKVVVFGQIWLYSRKYGCNRAKWLYLDKSGFYREKVVVFGIKVVVIGQIGCIR